MKVISKATKRGEVYYGTIELWDATTLCYRKTMESGDESETEAIGTALKYYGLHVEGFLKAAVGKKVTIEIKHGE